MILFCPFCRKAPDVSSSFGSTVRIECCGVEVMGRSGVGTERRWNEIARAVTNRKSVQEWKRLRKQAQHPDRVAEAVEAIARVGL